MKFHIFFWIMDLKTSLALKVHFIWCKLLPIPEGGGGWIKPELQVPLRIYLTLFMQQEVISFTREKWLICFQWDCSKHFYRIYREKVTHELVLFYWPNEKNSLAEAFLNAVIVDNLLKRLLCWNNCCHRRHNASKFHIKFPRIVISLEKKTFFDSNEQTTIQFSRKLK